MHSLKKEIIEKLALITGTQTDSSEKLNENIIVVTPAGVIEGHCSASEIEAGKLGHAIGYLVDEYIKNNGINEDDFPHDNDGYFILNDVTIHTSLSGSIKMPELVLFYDQVIGVSLGKSSPSPPQKRPIP